MYLEHIYEIQTNSFKNLLHMMKYRVGMLKNIRNYLSNKYWYLFIEDK